MNEVTPIAEPAESARFEDLFREPAFAHDSPLAFALGRKQDAVDALRGLFSGTPALVRLRLWCFLTLATHPQGRLSREDVNQLFHAVLPEPLDAALKRLRDLELLVWDATAQDYHLSALAQQLQPLLAPLTSAPGDDDELSGLLSQVAGAQQLGVLDANHLKHLHAQLARLHDDFADAIASGSEARLRQAQPRFDRALALVEKAGQALSAIIRDHQDHAALEKAARALGQDQARLLSMASQFTRALQQADRQRVTLGSTGLTSSDVRRWLQQHPALNELLGDALSVGVRPVFVSQHDLVDVAEGELERDRPDPARGTGLPPPVAAQSGSLDILSLPAELGHLVKLFGRWHEQAAPDGPPHTLADAVLNRRFAHAAYRMQLMPLLGDRQAAELKSQTGDLARAPWSLQLTPRLVPTQDTEVALISEGHFRSTASAAPDTHPVSE